MIKLIIPLLSLSLPLIGYSTENSYKNSDCFKKYEKREKKKREVAHEAFYGHMFVNGNGRIVHRKSLVDPTGIDNYERDMINSTSFDLETYHALSRKLYIPDLLGSTHKAAKRSYPSVTLEEVQLEIQKAFLESDFCKWYGIKDIKQARKILLKKIDKSMKEGAYLAGAEIYDSELPKDVSHKSGPSTSKSQTKVQGE